tara:strand:+ start:887 stop:1387 length:501 start_codon:yes stop_codon:yes gene_type:complete
MPLRSHIILSLGSLALLLAIAGQTLENSPSLRAALLSGTVDIGVEHAEPLSLHFEYTEREGAAIVRISHRSNETVSISLPKAWKRGEVSGAPLAELRQDKATFGLVRWHFPPRSGVTFSVKKAPLHIVIHNPSLSPLQLKTANANLMEGTVEKDIFLVQDGSVKIW